MMLCAACLLGIRCRFDGKSKPESKIVELAKKELLIPVCPEQLGGRPTPRHPQEIQGGSGGQVLDGKAKVKDITGKDVTGEFIRGAKETLNIARQLKADVFIGKSKSPACGYGKIYDGTFNVNLINGEGVASALLKRNGIKVMTEEDL